MTEYRRAAWRLIFITYPCPTCGAQPGEECRTETGHIYKQTHAARTRNGDRCPRCGTILMAHEQPGTLCARCQLLRRLETERATTHKRKT
jgi:ribosomal protein S27AE